MSGIVHPDTDHRRWPRDRGSDAQAGAVGGIIDHRQRARLDGRGGGIQPSRGEEIPVDVRGQSGEIPQRSIIVQRRRTFGTGWPDPQESQHQ
jgi:hypothetical protein